jgi:hypothetical protein
MLPAQFQEYLQEYAHACHLAEGITECRKVKVQDLVFVKCI